jgi:recombination protein RecA
MAGNGKAKALETTLATIQKRYGEGSIMRLGQAGHLQVEAIPTGSLALDLALGVGGVPRGRVTEIYGPVAALVPRAEIEGEMGDSHPGLQARLMSQALRKLSGAIKTSNTAMVFTNQLRQKIGVMFGNPETTSGGMALKFYASVRLDVRRIQAIKEGGQVIGNRTRIRVKKNKVAPPFRECEFDIMYDQGISKEGDVLDLGVDLDVIEKRGSFYSYKGERLAQGRENAKQALKDNPAICLEVENTIRSASGLPELLDAAPVADPETT